MGLAEPKSRMVFGADPRNLNWSEDKSRFGYKMLEQMGWSEGKGLGANEDGRKEHVKIKLKTNNFGIGADKKTIHNWLTNTDGFSELLTRLNSEADTPAEPDTAADGDSKHSKKDKKDKKDKDKKKSKKDKKQKDKKRSSNSEGGEDSSASSTAEAKADSTEKVLDAASARLNRLSHRTKFRNMKRMAMRDQKGLQEILGVRSAPGTFESTPASTEAVSEQQSGTATPSSSQPFSTVETGVSVSDYFAEKIKANPALAAIYGGSTSLKRRSSPQRDDEEDSKLNTAATASDEPKPSKKRKSDAKAESSKRKKDKKDKDKKDKKEKKSESKKSHKKDSKKSE
ncbi:hypothetical protein GGI12_001040 [Dipsacomyces acuminosporus]|nr:hypothetical protein GGI12_001040 [Dipsacomyces acuminosporus]